MMSGRTKGFAGLLFAAFGLLPACGDDPGGKGGSGGSGAGGGEGSVCTGTLTFGRLPLVSVEATPAAVALDDLDGDGAQDLVIATTNSASLLVAHRGKGNGTFGPPASVALPSRGLDLALGDVSGDGKLDAVVIVTDVVNGDSVHQIVILDGLGDGTFAAAKKIEIAAVPQRVALADVDGDGDLDIAVSASVPEMAVGELHVLRNGGGGSFAPSVAYGTGLYPLGIAATDFDGNGKIDLAVVNGNGGGVSVYLGNGDGSFAPQLIVPGDPYQQGIAVADFNADGKPDMAIENGKGFSVLVSAGGGAFAAPVAVPLFEGEGSGRIAAGDVNGDGKVDVAVVEANHHAHVALGNGDGTFTKSNDAFVGPQARALALAHLDGDSKLDLVVGTVDDAVAPLLGKGDGTFGGFATYPAVSEALDLSAADFDGDGKLDLAAGNVDGAIAIVRGQAGGAFADPEMLTVGPGKYEMPLASADFDGDGKQDLVAGHSSSVTVLPGKGDGKFGTGLPFGGGEMDQVFVEDADADGDPDIITVENSSSAAVSVLRNEGGLVFSSAGGYPAAEGGDYHAPARAAAGDFDGDGVRDLAVASRNALAFFHGGGDGTYAPAPSVPSPIEQPQDTVAADFDGDGDLDLAIGAFSNIAFAWGDGKGGFTVGEAIYAPTLYVTALAVADLDGNGRPDLVIANAMGDNLVDEAQGGEIAIMRGLSDGKMSSPERFLAGWQAEDVVIADIDGDGRLDLATVDPTSGTANVLLGGCVP
ncbi:FG-GAP repeat domain-containing protein [Polyangium aurulentum]|uniref:FG-GAP repeat domain-containing protein n=1 Tax=Polyangium aurulentum TaxID=2567896 RepID=UPI00146F2B50|nr:VCBS repeat-containing protein [Polyangium aurulentum]UQA56014.1 VCBS repeat-containing protein [Polyangium aurulentum]